MSESISYSLDAILPLDNGITNYVKTYISHNYNPDKLSPEQSLAKQVYTNPDYFKSLYLRLCSAYEGGCGDKNNDSWNYTALREILGCNEVFNPSIPDLPSGHEKTELLRNRNDEIVGYRTLVSSFAALDLISNMRAESYEILIPEKEDKKVKDKKQPDEIKKNVNTKQTRRALVGSHSNEVKRYADLIFAELFFVHFNKQAVNNVSQKIQAIFSNQKLNKEFGRQTDIYAKQVVTSQHELENAFDNSNFDDLVSHTYDLLKVYTRTMLEEELTKLGRVESKYKMYMVKDLAYEIFIGEDWRWQIMQLHNDREKWAKLYQTLPPIINDLPMEQTSAPAEQKTIISPYTKKKHVDFKTPTHYMSPELMLIMMLSIKMFLKIVWEVEKPKKLSEEQEKLILKRNDKHLLFSNKETTNYNNKVSSRGLDHLQFRQVAGITFKAMKPETLYDEPSLKHMTVREIADMNNASIDQCRKNFRIQRISSLSLHR